MTEILHLVGVGTWEQRFRSRFVALGPDECWPWTGKPTAKGYGQLHLPNRTYGAHVIAWVLHHGREVPKGLVLDHTCRRRICVNPRHLDLVQSRVNTARGLGPAATACLLDVCVHGHPLSGDNLYVDPTTKVRRCRRCRTEAERRRKVRRAEARRTRRVAA